MTDKQPATETRRTYQDKMCNCTHMMPHMGHSSTASHLQEGNILKSLRKKKGGEWWEAFSHFLSLILVPCINFYQQSHEG